MERGDVVPVRFGKWGGRPHWEMDLRFLGADQFGDWLGSPAGMPMRRPGWTTRTDAECAFYVPRVGEFVASFNDEDEFLEHQVDYGYPSEVVEAAQRSCDALVAAIAGGDEPWASVGYAWCARAVDLPLAPLPAWAEQG